MTIPIKHKSLNDYPNLCDCFKCDCNRIDQCHSRYCACCLQSDGKEFIHVIR